MPVVYAPRRLAFQPQLRHQQQKYRGEEPARCPSSGRRCCASDGETNVIHYYFNGPDRLIKSVTHDAVIRNFLKNEKVAQPLQYIQYPAHAQRKWMPAWFYVDQTGSTVAQISRNASFVAPCRHRSVLRKETAFRHSTGKAGELRSKLLRTGTGSTGADPDAWNRAREEAWRNPFPGVTPEACIAAMDAIRLGLGDTCPDC